MKNNNFKDKNLKVAIISSLTGGLGHYCAHLATPLSNYCNLKFITYPQIDLSGTVVKEITDSFIKKYIKWPRFDLDENNPKTIVDITHYLKDRNFNIINLHIGTTVKRKINYFTTLILYAKKINNIKFVFTVHDVFPFDEDIKLNKLFKIFYSLGDYFTVGNEKEKRKLIKYFNIDSSKIKIIPHGIYNLFDQNLYNKKLSRGYLGIPYNKKVILFFGFLREYKGFDYLIKASKILVKKDNSFLVYVASGLKYASKELVQKNLQLLHKLNLQDHFMLNLNYLDTPDIEAVFKSADVVVLPYTHVSQSGVLMMALGFKKPVVITDVFFEKNWIDKKAGFVAKTKDYESLADKIYTLINNESLLKKFGYFGYNYALKKFNWETSAKKFYKVFNSINK
ncbi:MAG: glycosyltransferase [Patescibacteria group bacterium]|nr:glycosyltransferase [Patescibacteria group bacterium]